MERLEDSHHRRMEASLADQNDMIADPIMKPPKRSQKDQELPRNRCLARHNEILSRRGLLLGKLDDVRFIVRSTIQAIDCS